MYKSTLHQLLKQPALIIILFLGIILFGINQYQKMPVDALPDISPVMVPVFAEGHGLAPEEIERLITYPIESSMNGLPGVSHIKSTSAFGMAVIYVYFHDDVNIYFARQLVSERLASTLSKLPDMEEPPALGPISTGLGQIFMYYLEADPKVVDTEGKELSTWLREYNDWVIKFKLQTVPGVTDVLSMGGHVLQYQIEPDPDSLHYYRLSLNDLAEAITNNNRNAGGQFLVLGSEEHLVRGIGLANSLEDLENIPVKVSDGTPVLLKDVSKIHFGNEIRRGVVTRNGEHEVVSGIVLKLFGENTSEVIKRLYDKVETLKNSLPEGLTLVPYYEQADLVKKATDTVKIALLQGAFLVLIVLLIFLGNWRTAVIVAFSIPICALIAVLFMGWASISANLMSLGGIAIAIGMLGDGSIVMVENIYRHMTDLDNHKQSMTSVIQKAASEVYLPIITSIAIIIAVFIPIFTLEGTEGKMFTPLAFTICFALLGSLFTALVFSPIACKILLKVKTEKPNKLFEMTKDVYLPLLQKAISNGRIVLFAAAGIFVISLFSLLHLGSEFIPNMDEGSVFIGVTMPPSIALEKAKTTVMSLEKELMTLPEVEETVSRVGRPEAGSHPHPVNYGEIHVSLTKPHSWRQKSKHELINAMEKKLSTIPGVQLNFTQPIQNSFDELLSGIKAQLAIKVYGEDLELLKDTASLLLKSLKDIPGLVDLSMEQSFGQPQVQVIPNRDACARYGVAVSDILQMVEMAVGGEVVDQLYVNTRRFGIHIRYPENRRSDPDSLRNLILKSGNNMAIPLSEVAEIKMVTGPLQINRENNQRKWTVQGNVRGSDLGTVVSQIKAKLSSMKFPSGITYDIGGQFENQQRAQMRLSIIVPTVMLLVAMLLWFSLGDLRQALIILLNVPLALAGGVAGLYIMNEYLSVPASVGFIALLGIAVQNGLVLVSYIRELQQTENLKEAVTQGALLRLRPVLMTAATTVLGLLPLLLANGTGANVQRPLAAVVVFGLATSTLLTLFVIPAAYKTIYSRK